MEGSKLDSLDARIPNWHSSDLTVTPCPACLSDQSSLIAVRHDGLPIRQCRDCTLLYVSPRPSNSAIERFYKTYSEDHRRANPDSGAYWSGVFRTRHRLQSSDPRMFFLKKSEVRLKGKRILDIGCGNGEFLLRCAKAGASHVLGVEPDIKMANGIKNKFGIDVVNGFANQLSPTHGKFDLIVLWDVLEHLTEPRELLASIKGSLAEGGRIAAVTPNGDGYLEEGINWTGFRVDFDHICYYGKKSATRLLQSCGYQMERMIAAGWPALESELLTGKVNSSTLSMFRHRLYELPVAGPALIKGASIRGLIENIGHNARGRYHLYLLAT